MGDKSHKGDHQSIENPSKETSFMSARSLVTRCAGRRTRIDASSCVKAGIPNIAFMEVALEWQEPPMFLCKMGISQHTYQVLDGSASRASMRRMGSTLGRRGCGSTGSGRSGMVKKVLRPLRAEDLSINNSLHRRALIFPPRLTDRCRAPRRWRRSSKDWPGRRHSTW